MSESFRILILEDRPADAELIQFELQEAEIPFTAKVVMTEKDYILELDENPPDIILSDYELPAYNGSLALAEARNRCPDTPFILVTGAIIEDLAIDILTQGAKDYVLKNRLQQRLGPAVRRALAEAAEHTALKQAEAELREAHRTLEERVKVRTAELKAEVAVRKKIEQTLRESEVRFRLAFKATNDAIWDIDLAKGEVHWNENYTNSFGRPPDTRNSWQWWTEHVHPEDRDRAVDGLKAAIEGGGDTWICEYRFLRNDGTWAYIYDRTFIARDESGTAARVVGAMQDVTERKRAEDQLFETNQRLQALMRAVPVGVSFSTDVTCQSVTGNPVVLEQFKVRPEENLSASAPNGNAPGRQVQFFRDGLQIGDSELPLQRAVAENKVIPPMELEVQLPHGRTWFAEASGAPVRDAQGNVVAGLAVTVDITERKRAEEALRTAHQKLKAVFDSITDAVFFSDLDGNFIDFNKAFATFHRFADKEECIRTLTEYPDYLDAWIADGTPAPIDTWPVRRALRGESGSDAEFKIRRKDTGEIWWASYSFAPIRGAGGKIVGTVVVGRDITERKRAEDAIHEGEARFRSVLDNSLDVIYRLNLQTGRFEYISPSAETVVGFTPAELMAQDTGTSLGMIHPDDLPVMQAALAHLEETGQTEAEYRQRAKSGNYRLISNHMTLTRDGAGQPLYRDGNIRDITERKQAEEVLRQSEERFRLALKNAPVSVAIQDCSLVYKWAYNQRTRRTDEIIGKTDADLFAPEDLAWIIEQKRQVLASGTELRVKNWLTSNGKRMFLDLYYKPMRDSAGEITGIGIAVVDLTEQKLAEDAQKESEERYRALFDGMTEGFAIHEIITDEQDTPVDYRFLDMNPAFERLTGLKRTDVIGKTVNEVLPGDDPKWLQMYGAVALTGEPVQFENYSPVLKRHYEVLAYRPAPRQFAVIFLDISERKNREKEQERLNQTLRALNKSNQAMMRATDERSYMEEICRIVVEDCGHAMVWMGFAEEDESKTVRPVAYSGFEQGYIDTLKISWADTERGRGPTGTAIREGQISTCRNMLTDPLFKPWREEALKRGYASSIVLPLIYDRKAFGALTIYSREPDPFSEDEVKLLTELARDLSYGIRAIRLSAARAKAEEALNERTVQLENTNKELESFSYSVSHDLRAPLRAIDGYSQMILKKAGDRFDEDTRDKFHIISSNAKKMNQLIDDLLSFSRLARQNPRLSKLDMEGLFRDAWQELQRVNPDRMMTLKIDKLPECFGDRNLMNQVCINILANAVKFTKLKDVALIEIGGCLQGNECTYFVKDNGAGFDMAFHDRLFGVFQRLHSDDAYEGTGIGLALVKRIISRHGGRVWAVGEVNKGATFFFTLPT